MVFPWFSHGFLTMVFPWFSILSCPNCYAAWLKLWHSPSDLWCISIHRLRALAWRPIWGCWCCWSSWSMKESIEQVLARRNYLKMQAFFIIFHDFSYSSRHRCLFESFMHFPIPQDFLRFATDFFGKTGGALPRMAAYLEEPLYAFWKNPGAGEDSRAFLGTMGNRNRTTYSGIIYIYIYDL